MDHPATDIEKDCETFLNNEIRKGNSICRQKQWQSKMKKFIFLQIEGRGFREKMMRSFLQRKEEKKFR